MAGNTGAWGWDTPNTEWVKMLVDAAGNLQVDVITSGLPLGGATAANQALIIADTGTLVTEQGRCYGYNAGAWQRLRVETAANANLRVRLYGGANAVLVGQSSAALAYTNYGIETFAILYGDDGTNLSRVGMLLTGADAVVNTLNTLGVASMLYGYNGVDWDRLRVQDAVNHNLRVTIYSGAAAVDAHATTANIGGTATGLVTRSVLYAFDVTNYWPLQAYYCGADALVTGRRSLITASILFGFNGDTFDRLRTYGLGILKVGRAEVGLLDVRLTAAGPVGAAGTRRLYWMLLNPSAGNSVVELTDAIAAGAAVKADHFDTTRDGHMITFDPPLEFSVGIYLETFTNMTSITFGYL